MVSNKIIAIKFCIKFQRTVRTKLKLNSTKLLRVLDFKKETLSLSLTFLKLTLNSMNQRDSNVTNSAPALKARDLVSKS